MCHQCWNADTKPKAGCTGSDWPILTLSQLKKTIEKELGETKQTSYRVYSDAIAEHPQGAINWVADETTFHIDFVESRLAG
jgi:hypothetical protein